MGSGNKSEVEVPKADAVANEVKVGKDKIRLQEYEKGEIHAHDDDAGLCFVYKQRRAFALGMDTFLKTQHTHAAGAVCVVHGEKSKPSKGSAGDLVLTRKPEGWEMSIAAAGTVPQPYSVLCDPIINKLDEFLQRL